jgi:hypothetical protein
LFNVAVWRTKIESLKSNTIIIAPDEAVSDQHILGIAWIDAIIVLNAGITKLHIPDCYLLAVLRYDGPMG